VIRYGRETQLTQGLGGRILTNRNVWSSDGHHIVYDTRSGAAGERFNGTRIEMINIQTRETRLLYETRCGADCGVVTWHPSEPLVAFILGPEHPTPDWTYGPSRRQGVVVDVRTPGVADLLDARDLTTPFTPGALRGGSHVHIWHPQGDWISFTYEDEIIRTLNETGLAHDVHTRTIGVSITGTPITVSRGHPRNHDGTAFSFVAVRTTANPRPGSDDVTRAVEESWIGTNGYRHSNGQRQHRALAFQGTVLGHHGQQFPELFAVDIPDVPLTPGNLPLEGTTTRMPAPPRGCAQRRISFTESHRFPGLSGPRHWVHSSPDGSQIGFLKRDETGTVQFWTASPSSNQIRQVTTNPVSVASAFTWHPNGRHVAFVMDNSVCVTDTETGITTRITERTDDLLAPRPEACVFSPDGSRIAFVRIEPRDPDSSTQIWIVDVEC
jgi:WD40 repeat protein